jgi:hypothetical protein
MSQNKKDTGWRGNYICIAGGAEARKSCLISLPDSCYAMAMFWMDESGAYIGSRPGLCIYGWLIMNLVLRNGVYRIHLEVSNCRIKFRRSLHVRSKDYSNN